MKGPNPNTNSYIDRKGTGHSIFTGPGQTEYKGRLTYHVSKYLNYLKAT